MLMLWHSRSEDLMRSHSPVLAGQKEYSPQLMEVQMTAKNPLPSELLVMKRQQQSLNKEVLEKSSIYQKWDCSYIIILTKLAADNRTSGSVAQDQGWI